VSSRNGISAVLDIGSSKIVCLIMYINQNGTVDVIGVGHHISSGFKAGVITDIKAAETSIISAITMAEKMANESIDRVNVSVSGGQIESDIINSVVDIGGDFVTAKEVNKVVNAAIEQFLQGSREIVHYFPLDYQVDGVQNIKNPILMYGARLTARTHIISATSNLVLNLANCLARCQIDVENFILASYASGVACLTQDEMELGVTLIDIGSNITEIAVFNQSNIVFAAQIPLGGYHITSDLAKGLSIGLSDAERIKNLFGSIAPNTAFSDRKHIEIKAMGDDDQYNEPMYVEAGEVNNIIAARVEEIFDYVKMALVKYGAEQGITKRIVLTGGTSQLIGIKDFSANYFGAQVRIGLPRTNTNVAKEYKTPAFASSLGMAELVAKNSLSAPQMPSKSSGKASYLKKIFQWL
jgi:cell division protein FtsA